MLTNVFSIFLISFVWINGNQAVVIKPGIEPPPAKFPCPGIGIPEIKGEKGVAGLPGTNGQPGVKGESGVPGTNGDAGKNGAKGSMGLKGDIGLTGKAGQAGPAGMKGQKGDEGKCDDQCGDIKKLEKKLQKLQSNFTEEIEQLKEKIDYLDKNIHHALGSESNPAVSCKAILNRDRNARNGPHYISVKGYPGEKVLVYCIMNERGNVDCPKGLTQVMKIDGSKGTFKFSSPYWSNKNAYNAPGGKTGCDYTETKLPTYWSTPFTKICIRMRLRGTYRIVSRSLNVQDRQTRPERLSDEATGGGGRLGAGMWETSQALTSPVVQSLPEVQESLSITGGHDPRFTASSLYDLIADGKYRMAGLARSAWKGLLQSSSLQSTCTREGFNVQGPAPQDAGVRIGIIGDNTASCKNPDSYIGFGTEGSSCGMNPRTSCGNEARCGADNGDKDIQAHGYIYVY